MRKKLFLLFVLFFLLAGNNCFAAIPIEVPLSLFGLPQNPTLPQYILFFFQLAIAMGGILAVLSLVFNGIRFIISAGSPEGISEAKNGAKSAILGLILLLSSFIIIMTINPSLKNLNPTETLSSIGQLYFVEESSYLEKPAPRQMENLDAIKQEFGKIKWKFSITGLDGKPISNCRYNNPNLVFVIYLYKDYNFKNFYQMARMKCGGEEVDITGANSYKVIEETPGVYFYGALGCAPKGDTPPTPHTQSEPQNLGTGQNVQSIRIVNGPDPKKGEFFGLIFMNSTDYRTSEGSSPFFFHIRFSANLSQEEKLNNNSRCFSGAQIGNRPSNGVSWVIYKWVGYDENSQALIPADAGNGVTLYSEISWSGDGGKHEINLRSAAQMSINLQTIPIDYPENTTTPKERRDVCEFFNPAYSCLQSFEITGNFLVLVSNGNFKAQVFPMSSRLYESYKNKPEGFSIERGTPKITSDYIGSKSAYYMEIIPLAERLR